MMTREYKTIRALKAGKTVEVEGVSFRKVSGNLEPGDTYIAERNTGPKLLTVLRVDDNIGCVFPKEDAYPYDYFECVKVEMADTV